ncbi:hypothetical protein ACF3MZ_15180 [Paenibacillaceae bacterium WGS1546]|uniref:hypothetical protein n=1 Tax=Cohnella sp. WGS1546 TaxID=3366810 RepID=UPI00372D16A1
MYGRIVAYDEETDSGQGRRIAVRDESRSTRKAKAALAAFLSRFAALFGKRRTRSSEGNRPSAPTQLASGFEEEAHDALEAPRLPDEFPLKAVIPEDSELTGAVRARTDDGVGYLATYFVRRSVDDVREYYRSRLAGGPFPLTEYADGTSAAFMGGDRTTSLLIHISSNEEEGTASVSLSWGARPS